MARERICFATLLVGSLVLAPRSSGAIVLPGDPADAVVRADGSRLTGASGRVGGSTSFFKQQLGGRAAVFVFALPAPGPGQLPEVAAASFQFTIVSDQPDGVYGIDLYGLGARSAPAVWSGDYYAGASDATDATLIQDDIIPPAHPDRRPDADEKRRGPQGDRVMHGLTRGRQLSDQLHVEMANLPGRLIHTLRVRDAGSRGHLGDFRGGR